MKRYLGYGLLLLIALTVVTVVSIRILKPPEEDGMARPDGMRAIQVSAESSGEVASDFYNDSYALVVGNGNYTEGWDPLPGAIRDVGEVAQALKKQGFEVTLRNDLTRDEFNDAFADFVYTHGKDTDNRLLFYYAGHGHTRKMATDEQLGYLVMVDAPRPEDFGRFRLHSVDMVSIVTEAKMIAAKHVLFMFDSCFSGTVLNLRDSVTPNAISDNTKRPVRQFITAGRADESVPDYSVFKQSFLDILEGRDKEPIEDGYLTGEELGLYLKNKVPSYNRNQHPQYGKIRDPKLDKGDFVFLLASSSATVEGPAASAADSTVSIESNVSGARVHIDGRYVGVTDLSALTVSPGQHRIMVEKEGYDSYTKTVTVDRGRSASLYVDLTRESPAKARLYVDTDPSGARVRILNIEPRFHQGIELDAGRYNVEVSADGYQKETLWVTLDAGEDKRIDVRLKETPARATTGGTWTDPVTGMEFVWIPQGCFQMGSPSGEDGRYDREGPVHEVCVDGFWMGKTEVTNAQYRRYKSGHDSKDYEGKSLNGGDQPAVYVSWEDAKAFAKWLSRENGGHYEFRLPTEAQWEYAARAGTRTARYWGNNAADACRYANVHDRTSKQVNKSFTWEHHNCDDGYAVAAPVGRFLPNGFGLHDILGNVYEWCEDVYDKEGYRKHSRSNPLVTSGGSRRVIRGGSWYGLPRRVRGADRGNDSPGDRYGSIGFRLLRTH